MTDGCLDLVRCAAFAPKERLDRRQVRGARQLRVRVRGLDRRHRAGREQTALVADLQVLPLRGGPALHEARRRERPAASRPGTSRSGRPSSAGGPSPVVFRVSLTGRPSTAPAPPLPAALRSTAAKSAAVRQGRAPSCTATQSDEATSAAASAAPTESCRRPAALDRGDPRARRARDLPQEHLQGLGREGRRRRDDDTVDLGYRQQPLDGPRQQGSAEDRDELLGLLAAEPAAAARGRDDGVDGQGALRPRGCSFSLFASAWFTWAM